MEQSKCFIWGFIHIWFIAGIMQPNTQQPGLYFHLHNDKYRSKILEKIKYLHWCNLETGHISCIYVYMLYKHTHFFLFFIIIHSIILSYILYKICKPCVMSIGTSFTKWGWEIQAVSHPCLAWVKPRAHFCASHSSGCCSLCLLLWTCGDSDERFNTLINSDVSDQLNANVQGDLWRE